MTRHHLISIRAIPVAMLGALLICPPTYAQTDSGTSSTTTRAEQKQELKTLEQNGYHPGGDDIQYPSDIQRAEKKAQGQPVSPNPNLP